MVRLQRVFIDSSELFPFTIMDVLLTLSEDFLFTWVWTDELLEPRGTMRLLAMLHPREVVEACRKSRNTTTSRRPTATTVKIGTLSVPF